MLGGLSKKKEVEFYQLLFYFKLLFKFLNLIYLLQSRFLLNITVKKNLKKFKIETSKAAT